MGIQRQSARSLFALWLALWLGVAATARAQVDDGAPLSRGAQGGGSMQTGEGLRPLPEEEDARPPEPALKPAETGHGGNETDMEHRRRPGSADKGD